LIKEAICTGETVLAAREAACEELGIETHEGDFEVLQRPEKKRFGLFGGCLAKVRVFITSTDHKFEWGTVGVSENIVEASWEALIDSFDYYYNNIILNN